MQIFILLCYPSISISSNPSFLASQIEVIIVTISNHEDLEMINPSSVRLFQMKMFQIKGWRKDFLRRIPFRGKRKLTISCNFRKRIIRQLNKF